MEKSIRNQIMTFDVYDLWRAVLCSGICIVIFLLGMWIGSKFKN